MTASAAVIEHKLYWAAVGTIDEARYLIAVLNSSVLLERVAPLQNRGLFGARGFDKYVFSVPIPLYDAQLSSHRKIAKLAQQAEAAAEEVVLEDSARFQAKRKSIREHLGQHNLLERIDAAVADVISPTV